MAPCHTPSIPGDPLSTCTSEAWPGPTTASPTIATAACEPTTLLPASGPIPEPHSSQTGGWKTAICLPCQIPVLQRDEVTEGLFGSFPSGSHLHLTPVKTRPSSWLFQLFARTLRQQLLTVTSLRPCHTGRGPCTPSPVLTPEISFYLLLLDIVFLH
jgi:hypothetical protein